MTLDFPIPNTTCLCGQLLFSWAEVQAHWQQHQASRRAMQAIQAEMRAAMARRPA